MDIFVTHSLTFDDFQIVPDDGLPSLVCHKCLVLTENCMDFRDKCHQNDEKLRLIFKIEPAEPLLQVPEAVPEIVLEAEPVEEEEEEVITLNPNKLYESSDESEAEIVETERVLETHQVVQTTIVTTNNNSLAPKVVSDVSKKEIYHCQFCDVVFSDSLACNAHEQKSHDSLHPFECVACSFKTDQHSTLILHIKQTHNLEKPFLCTQCSKSFIRRSDLKKHTFVHAGIRLYSCDICKKSFTRNTNLTKHKRTHSEKSKTWKCTLCPRAFYTNSELSRHLEVHMDKKAMNCKYCNQAFMRRDLLELHKKTHFENNAVVKNEAALPAPPAANTVQPQPMVYFNQQPELAAAHQPAPMNFYTENVSYNMFPSNGAALQTIQPKNDYPIMNQLLTGMNHMNQNVLQPVKNYVCGICSNAFFKKKELDRHVITIHTTVKQFKCESCSKTFNRKDKLLRHEKVHSMPPPVFNCSLCPAVFLRKQMLDFHSKIHQIGNGEQIENLLASLQPVASGINGYINNSCAPIAIPFQLETQHHTMPEMIQPSISAEQPATIHPMNLTVNKSEEEPMNLSNDKVEQPVPVMKLEPSQMVVDSDDEADGLQIIEEPTIVKKSPSLLNLFKSAPASVAAITQAPIVDQTHEPTIADSKPRLEEPMKSVDEITFSMTSRIAELNKLEPLRDLPMEILNND